MTPPVSTTDAPTVASAAPRPPRGGRRIWLAAGGGLLALGVAASVLALTHSPANSKEADLAADLPRVQGDRIAFSEEFRKRAGLATEAAVAAELTPVITATGAVDFDPALVAVVGTRLHGLVSQVTKFEGDTVEKGALLAVIESPELGEAQANLSSMHAQREAASLNSRRESELLEKNLSTAREAELALVELRKSEAMYAAAAQKVGALTGGPGGRTNRLGTHEVRSPIAGTVVECHVAAGQAVEGQMAAFKIANMDRLWAELSVFENNLGNVRVGDRVELEALANPGTFREGRVARIGAALDPETRSAAVRVEIENKNGHLRAGQSVNAKIHASGRASSRGQQGKSTLVPSRAVTYVDGKPTLFVAESPTLVRVAKVELGANDGQLVAIKEGVSPGEQVVTEGAFALKSELFR
jgi:cobalt-zinc-cadmium efflux system membrane fusion protein